jgi:hypothetical protein
MFLSKDYILANELVEKMGIHIANISMLRNEFENVGNMTDIVKLNNCSFINTKSINLPNNIKNGIAKHTFTDVSDKLPMTFLRSEYDLSAADLRKAGIITGDIKITDKKFFIFKQDFIEKVKGSIVYLLDDAETKECLEDGSIDGAIKITKNKYITWYKVY